MISVILNHAPWVPARVTAIALMLDELHREPTGLRVRVHDTDYRDRDWQDAKVDWALDQWSWAMSQPAAHHLFLTDDLHLMPGFTAALRAMLEVVPNRPIGLLSNHPSAGDLEVAGHHWYKTNSWIVGPAYVLPHAHLVEFLKWFEALPEGREKGQKAYANDDSSLNEWITFHGPGETYHPLPTIIEHRHDIESTVGHGDMYSRERLSWRAERWIASDGGGAWSWLSAKRDYDVAKLRDPEWWKARGGPAIAPMMPVGGP